MQNSTTILQLPPIPPPGLALFPGYTAHHPTTLVMKENYSLSKPKNNFKISYASPTGGQGVPAFTAYEEKKKQLVFRSTTGQEVMRVVKQEHKFSGRGEEYHGVRPDGTEVWYCKLHRGLTGTEYHLSINPTPYTSQTMLVQNKVLGQDKGILWNGQPVATMSQPEAYSHLRREDVVNVAAGMDILLSLGICFVRYDKQAGDAKIVASAVG